MIFCTKRSELVTLEGERDQALKAVGELSSRTDSLEEQLERLGRLLKEAQVRAHEKAKQLQDAEVSEALPFYSHPVLKHLRRQ